MIKEIPVLMSTPMVQATLDGRKTKTRRIVTGGFDPNQYEFVHIVQHEHVALGTQAYFKDEQGRHWGIKCKYGDPGDILWVRESHKPKFVKGGLSGFMGQYPGECPWIYATDEEQPTGYGPWKPSIHMPKDAARIWLRLITRNIEKLHDISAADVEAEGVQYPVTPSQVEGKVSPLFKLGEENSALSFLPADWKELPYSEKEDALMYAHWAELWCSINGRESWDANPYVWVLEYEVLSTTGKPEFI